MNTNCSLTTHRIVVRSGKRLLLYANPDDRDRPALLDTDPEVVQGTVEAIHTDDDWLIVPGGGGLPLSKVQGLRSIEEAWDYEVVDLYRRRPDGSWEKIEDWGK